MQVRSICWTTSKQPSSQPVDPDAPSTLKDGGVIAKGYHSEVDELRSIRDNTKGVLAQLETRLRQETGIPKLKIGYNHVFGYFIEVSNSYKQMVPETYIRKQTLTSGERYITQELKDLENKILGAHERLIALEHRLFAELLEKIGGQLDRIQRTANAVAELDVLRGAGAGGGREQLLPPRGGRQRRADHHARAATRWWSRC